MYPEEPSLDAVARLDKKYEESRNGADVKVFDKLYIRHWDAWTETKKKLVFTVELEKKSGSSLSVSSRSENSDIHSLSSEDEGEELHPERASDKDARWTFIATPSTPLAHLENIECPPRPFGDSNDFDLTPDHLVFAAKDPHLPEAWHSRMHIYLVPLYPRNENDKKPRCLTSQGGARGGPVFSPQAKAGGKGSSGKVAWLEMRKDGYESDRNRVMVYDLEKDTKFGITENWDRSPTSLSWGEDGETLYAAAEVSVEGSSSCKNIQGHSTDVVNVTNIQEEGHKKLFVLNVPDSVDGANVESNPRVLTKAHTVSSFAVLPTPFLLKPGATKEPAPGGTTHILLTMNSYTSPNEAHLLTVPTSTKESPSLRKISSLASELVEGLGLDPAEEFWFAGADPDRQVHGFIMKPHGYEAGKKYGMAFLVHGGPQGAWTSSW